MSSEYSHIVCHFTGGFCKINTPCANETDFLNWEINIAVEDGTRILPIKIKDKDGDLLINGTDVGDLNVTCYLPIFRAQVDQDVWYLGGLFLEQYFVVFDATPKDEYFRDYMQVGLAR